MGMMDPITCIIFDLDGTIFDCGHRMHFIEGEDRDWDSFFAACVDDEPIMSLVNCVLQYQAMGFEIVFVTGRPESIRTQTEEGLKKAGISKWGALYMRAARDYSPAATYKKRVLDLMRKSRWHPVLAVDDDIKAAQMFFENGVPCFVVV